MPSIHGIAIRKRYAWAWLGVDLFLSAHIGLGAQMQAIDSLAAAVRAGDIPEERINQSARRVLAAKERYGLKNAMAC